MSRTTYHVIACIDGRFDVMGDTADPNETVSQVAERAYNGQPYRSVERDNLHESAGLGSQRPPECQVHQSPMVWVNRNGGFWSCHRKNLDGSWCTYRPPQ